MAILLFAEHTWSELLALDRNRLAVILPVGATEAHGPHLPLSTDAIIGGAMARRAAELLDGEGWTTLLLPSLDYTPAPFAEAFCGTLSVRPEIATGLVVDLGRSLHRHGFRHLGIANAHLDPAHLDALRTACDELERQAPELVVAFPDLTRRPWAQALGEEFASGACHAGRYEGSIVLAARPDLVREDIGRSLPPNPASLSQAIRAGCSTFAEAGGPQAYFGDPAVASAAEGEVRIDTLGRALAQAILGAHHV